MPKGGQTAAVGAHVRGQATGRGPCAGKLLQRALRCGGKLLQQLGVSELQSHSSGQILWQPTAIGGLLASCCMAARTVWVFVVVARGGCQHLNGSVPGQSGTARLEAGRVWLLLECWRMGREEGRVCRLEAGQWQLQMNDGQETAGCRLLPSVRQGP